MIPITEIFHIRYGNQFDFSKMDTTTDLNGINFISRSSQNNGFMSKVEKYNDTEPFEAGLITVTMGGSYLLASFVQPDPFYTAQNIKVLKPKIELTLKQKLFYCTIIEANRFRYHSHSREANSTFDEMVIPSPDEFNLDLEKFSLSTPFINNPLLNKHHDLISNNWLPFNIEKLFTVCVSNDSNLTDSYTETEGNIPYISSTQSNNGISGYIDADASNDSNTITVARNGSVGSTFYQPKNYCASPDDIRILKPKFICNKYVGMFLITVIEREKYRYAYGRKFGTKRLKDTIIFLPSTKEGDPDFIFMEEYIKSLNFSNLI